MSRHRLGKPYIRRAHPLDRSASMIAAFRMAYCEQLRGGRYYVLVRHGYPHEVLAADLTRRGLMRRIVPVAAEWESFRAWQASIKRQSRPDSRSFMAPP